MSKQTETALQYIRERILDGTYKPSQKLIESQLSELIGVSRNTVKKALLKLEQENLVKVENNKGASIQSFTLEEVLNYLEIREVLEGLVARSVARTIGAAELQKLKGILDKMALQLKNNHLDEYSIFNKEFHGIIYGAARNAQAVELINMIKTQLQRVQLRTILVPGRNRGSYNEHKKIFGALKAHNEKAAEAALRVHVANIRQTIARNYQLFL